MEYQTTKAVSEFLGRSIETVKSWAPLLGKRFKGPGRGSPRRYSVDDVAMLFIVMLSMEYAKSTEVAVLNLREYRRHMGQESFDRTRIKFPLWQRRRRGWQGQVEYHPDDRAEGEVTCRSDEITVTFPFWAIREIAEGLFKE